MHGWALGADAHRPLDPVLVDVTDEPVVAVARLTHDVRQRVVGEELLDTLYVACSDRGTAPVGGTFALDEEGQHRAKI